MQKNKIQILIAYDQQLIADGLAAILSGESDFNIIDTINNEDLKSEISKLTATESPPRTLNKIEAILKTRSNLAQNVAPLLLIEALMCELR